MKKTIIALFMGLNVVHFAIAQTSSEAEAVPADIGQTNEAGEVAEPLFTDPNAIEKTQGEGGGIDSVDTIEVAPLEDEDGGFLIKDANINDIFQLLAKRADKQYFHNNDLNAEQYKVTGHLNGDTSSLKQMEELAFQYGLRMYVKGNTVYAMLSDQLDKLPAKEWTYSLNYLRPTDIEQIKALILPMLSPGRGIVNYEPKTNTIIVIDTMHHIEMVENLLRKIDKPKGQIVIETKILRVNSVAGERLGVNWAASLGSSGVSLSAVRSLNSVFGIEDFFAGTFRSDNFSDGNLSDENVIVNNNNLILSPFQIDGVLRALNDVNIVSEKANPVIITEDNEKASIALIDRIPIITTTVNNTSSGSTVTEEVRYTIDEADSTDPETTREIGVTISMTPSLLPDGTIRLKMRPRSAEVTENIEGVTGNVYPRVSEATIETIARIPDGHSLVIGGFFSETKSNTKTKVPLLGDIPVLNFFFKSKENSKEQASLVFVVTPNSYNPSSRSSNRRTSNHVNNHLKLKSGYESADDSNPGAGHEPNLERTIRGMRSNVYPQR